MYENVTLKQTRHKLVHWQAKSLDQILMRATEPLTRDAWASHIYIITILQLTRVSIAHIWKLTGRTGKLEQNGLLSKALGRST